MITICQGPGCGIRFETTRKTAKYHCDACRQRARRHPELIGQQMAAGTQRRTRTRLQEATEAELARAGQQDSAFGITALELAEAIDAGAESGAALASMVNAHAAAMERALRVGPADDPVAARAQRVQERALSVVKTGDGAG